MKISYNWLKSYLPNIPEVEKLADIFTYHLTEVEGVEKREDEDTIFDINILPNRAHDLLSHQGIARELSGQLGIEFKDPASMYKTPTHNPTALEISIETDVCRRYMGRVVRNVKVGPSPEWVVKHLESIGQRSINNIVDATNIIMYDCGQPCHAFDLRKINNSKIQIINAQNGEELKLVGREGVIAKLQDSDIVISSGGNNLALAGVKGGVNSGIVDDTTDIVLEVANFDPVSVRKTAHRLKIFSDSAKRFENDLSPELCDFAMFELSALLVEFFPDAEFEEIVDIYPKKQETRIITFSTELVNKMLGAVIADVEIEKILGNYKYEYKKEGSNFMITVPPLRLDIQGSYDMVEEIGRVYGYDKIVPILPKIDFIPKENSLYLKTQSVRAQLTSEGYKEVMTYSFTNSGDIEVLASASDKNFLRTNITDGLKESVILNSKNSAFLGLNEIKVFEIGAVFTQNGEEMHVAFGDKKKITEMKLEDWKKENSFNFEFSFSDNKFKMWSLYPAIVRDVAVWVPENVDTKDLENIYISQGTDLLVCSPRLVDQFKKEGRVSYAYRLVFQSYSRTLTDDEVNKIMQSIIAKIAENPLFEVR